MKIRLLGTAAAEGIPAFYSDSRVSNHAREHGGRNVRSRAAALVDGCLKIDLGPDTLMQMHRDRLDARDWLAVLFTHSHDDHFTPSELQYGLHPFSHGEHMPFPIYANESIIRRISEMYPDWPMELVVTRSFQTTQIGPYNVTPIRANHLLEEDSHNLLIESGGKTLLYGTDTGWWQDASWEHLAGVKIDLLVIECTNGNTQSDYFGHMGIPDVLRVVERMNQIGAINGDTKLVSTHHSHNGNMTYDELVLALEPHGIVAGYDGLEVEI